jgi:hypothetical protein
MKWGRWVFTRFSGHSRLIVPSCYNHEVVAELLNAGWADNSEAGGPVVRVMPTSKPLKHRGGELNSTGPGLTVEQIWLHGRPVG